MFELTNYAVPAEICWAKEGNGFRIAMTTLISGRLSVAAGCVGVIEDCLIEAMAYAKERHQHGKPIAKHQLVQEHLASIEMGRQAAESLLANAISAKEAARNDPKNAACASGPISWPPMRSFSPATPPAKRPTGPCRCWGAAATRSFIVRGGTGRRSRLPHLRGDRRNPQAENRRRPAREGIRRVPLTGPRGCGPPGLSGGLRTSGGSIRKRRDVGAPLHRDERDKDSDVDVFAQEVSRSIDQKDMHSVPDGSCRRRFRRRLAVNCGRARRSLVRPSLSPGTSSPR